MSRLHVRAVIAALAFAAGPALASDYDQPIEVNTDALPSYVAEQVKKRAAESERALMQYMWFTRRMHHLWIDDVSKPKADDRLADAQPAPEKRVYVVVRAYGR